MMMGRRDKMVLVVVGGVAMLGIGIVIGRFIKAGNEKPMPVPVQPGKPMLRRVK